MIFKRKNKFEKINRSEIVDKIISFEKERETIEDSIVDQENEIQQLYKKGYAEKNQQLRVVYANKIKRMKTSNSNLSKRLQYLDYNINLLDKLKTAIDDQQFMKKNSKDNLVQLLGDSKSLTEFLSKSISSKKAAEDNLVGANQVFTEMDELYESNDEIYGTKDDEVDILAQFERGAMLEQEMPDDSSFEENIETKKEKI